MKILLTALAELVIAMILAYTLVKFLKWLLISLCDYDNVEHTIRALYPSAYNITLYKGKDKCWHAEWIEQELLFTPEKEHTIIGKTKSSVIVSIFDEYELANHVTAPKDDANWKPKSMQHE